MSTGQFHVDVHPGDRAAFPRPSFVKITRLELRKILDVRSGPALLVVTLLLALLVLGLQVFAPEPSSFDENGNEIPPPEALVVRFADIVGGTNQVVVYIVPVLALLAMTSEWTQRTALTTFTLVPRRPQVLLAKLAAALVLAVAVTAVIVALSAVATLLRAAVKNGTVEWSGSAAGGSFVATALATLMGAALGALIMVTAPAIVAYYIGPTILVIIVTLSTRGEGEAPEWINVQEAFARLSSFDLQGKAAQTISACLLWVVLPLLGGLWRSLRRDAS